MENCNILFTSVGRRVALVKGFRAALARMGIKGTLFGADLKTNAPGLFVADERVAVPRCNDTEYIPALLRLCREREVRLLVPLIDPELPVLAETRASFQEIGTTALVSGPETVAICRDKRDTGAFFEKAGVLTPVIYDIDEVLASDSPSFPYLLKPADGSCSQGVTVIRNKRELDFFREYVPNAILQELLVGKEYTMDVFTDLEGGVHCVVPRWRIETRAGEVSKGRTTKDVSVMEACKKVVEALPDARGCITVQCFVDRDGVIKFTEVNPRFGGGAPLAIQAGAAMPRWSIELSLGRRLGSYFDGWQDGLTMLRYDDGVFVEDL